MNAPKDRIFKEKTMKKDIYLHCKKCGWGVLQIGVKRPPALHEVVNFCEKCYELQVHFYQANAGAVPKENQTGKLALDFSDRSVFLLKSKSQFVPRKK